MSEYCRYYSAIALKPTVPKPVQNSEKVPLVVDIDETEQVKITDKEQEVDQSLSETKPEVNREEPEVKNVEDDPGDSEESENSDTNSEAGSVEAADEVPPPHFFHSYVPCTHQV